MKKIQFASSNTIADQMLDLYAVDNRKSSIEIIKIRANKDPLNDKPINEVCIGKFLTEWINLERMLEDLSRRFGSENMIKNRRDAMARLSKCMDMPQRILEAYWKLKKIRNMLVHGVEIPEDKDLLLYIGEIVEVRKEIKSFFDEFNGQKH